MTSSATSIAIAVVDAAKNKIDEIIPDAVSLNTDVEGSLPIGGVNVNVGVGILTLVDNKGKIFGTFCIGANTINSGGYSISATAGSIIYNSNEENISTEDISGNRTNYTVVGGAEGVVGKY